MNNFNILFTSAGRRVSLIKHFKQVLRDLQLQGSIITTDLRKDAPASFVSDYHELVPRVTDAGYIDNLLKICKRHSIQLVVPLIDTELILLAENKERFRDIGVEVLVSSIEVNKVCFDKKSTRDFFLQNNISMPLHYDIEEVLMRRDIEFPLLLKPAKGSSSKGVTIINNYKELEFFKDYIQEPVLQELVKGDEYTVDVLVDFNQNIHCVVPRLRIETRAGEVSKGKTVKNEIIIEATKKVVEFLAGSVGCITVQCFLTKKNEVKFIEINPRFGGGHPLAIAAGADFPRFIIQMIIGQELGNIQEAWQEDLVMLRYDDAVFVEGDKL